MYKNRFTAIYLNQYSKSKHYFCTWGLLLQFYNHWEIVRRQTATQEDTGPGD